eukprot:CAMPEP_0197027664 /NCGR_PEP_ID=MMETSP1384-20130603/7535_1 /TAXON_ID=29189 /ORGANISM="Ammonia sp." /LENGTH=206 /DNA_ID=CAMNT_0042456541 /DNA_START=173 /DNA_END=793 /DNA_ORIENTATION=-
MHAANPNAIPTATFQEVCKRHIIHHSLTKDDMTLVRNQTDTKYEQLKIDKKLAKYEGLYFLWPVTIFIWFIFVFAFYITNSILPLLLPSFISNAYDISTKNALLYGTLYCVYMNAMWNYIHPDIHYANGLKMHEGLDLVPRVGWFRTTRVYQFLWKNHVLHHLCTGQDSGNFNVTFLGADWLFGTYRTQCRGYKIDAMHRKITKSK